MATAQQPDRVSSADFIRSFGNWRLQAARRPVVVTHHGKDAHVLISLADYQRLESVAPSTANALVESQAGLLESIRDAVLLIDRQWRVAALNPAAGDMLEATASSLAGRPLTDALPGIEASLVFHHIVRMIDYRERFSGDVPGLLRPRQWLRADLVPVRCGGAIVLRDVSDTIAGLAATDAREATLAAVEVSGEIGHARVSVRETIEAANPALTAMVGVEDAAIRRVRFSALLAVGERQNFAETLESVLRTGTPARIASQLVTRDGDALPVRLSIAELRGAYASDGAVILVTRR